MKNKERDSERQDAEMAGDDRQADDVKMSDDEQEDVDGGAGGGDNQTMRKVDEQANYKWDEADARLGDDDAIDENEMQDERERLAG